MKLIIWLSAGSLMLLLTACTPPVGENGAEAPAQATEAPTAEPTTAAEPEEPADPTEEPTATTPPTDVPPDTEEVATPEPQMTLELAPTKGAQVPAGLMSLLRADLEERTGATAAEISVSQVEEVTWNDGSLGCPEPGVMYTQALVPGFVVVLETDGEQYQYHTDSAETFVLCENE